MASCKNKSPCICYTVPNLASPILKSSLYSNLLDHYFLGSQLGWGQFGIIRECTNKLTREKFACKSIAKDRLVTEEDLQSVKLEIEIMSLLSGHPNVVELKAVYEEEHSVHLVMELCAGGELFHLLERNGRFNERQARVLFRHLMEVVMFCHDNGIVHRDLKPENILLVSDSPSSPIKLADFGLATFIKPGKSLSGTVGSPFYIAPEVLGGGYNQAADVWSAGVILYILLSGIPPFWAKTKSGIFNAVRAAKLSFPSDLWCHVSRSAVDLISRMLTKDPAQRPSSAQVLDHPWMRETDGCDAAEDYNEGFSFSTAPLTCKSSFSSFLAGDVYRGSNGGFSFRRSGKIEGEFATSIQSMPSFEFFGMAPDDGVQRDSSFGESFLSAEERSCREERESDDVRDRKAAHSSVKGKRNRTFGGGEAEAVDLVVSDSIIRWASCTHLRSLTSSLVC